MSNVKVTCFCGVEFVAGEEVEVSPSMFYVKPRTCSTNCHNKWVLGHYDGQSGVGDGWVPIVNKLHEDIKELCPDYVITQIKEKLAGLRFYADFNEPDLPLGITEEEVWSIQSMKSTLYYELQKIDDPEGWLGDGTEVPNVPDWEVERMRKDYANLTSVVKKLRPIQALIDEAEELSYKTCEWCGDQGSMDNTQVWLLTLCNACKSDRADGWRPWDES